MACIIWRMHRRAQAGFTLVELMLAIDAYRLRNYVPINSECDLYSMGADRQTVAPLTAKASRDDVIMANDGAFFGLASDC
jgi:hypothetical protein